MVGFIFGGNTGLSNEELQRRRQIAQALMQQKEQPTNVATGLASATQSIVGALLDRKLGKEEDRRREEYNQQFSSVFGGYGGSGTASTSGSYTPSPPSPEQALRLGMGGSEAPSTITPDRLDMGVEDTAPANWEQIKNGIFAGESGGDYNALYGYQNRPGGKFANVRLTDMTVDQALQFASPSGPYGQHVKNQIGRVATPMGAYQVVGTTLKAAKKGLGLTGNERMTPQLQDRIGQWILAEQGTGAWEGYRGPRTETVSTQGGYAQPSSPQYDMSSLISLASNPYANDSQRAIVNALMNQQLKQQDPMYQAQLEKARAKPNSPTSVQEFEYAKANGYQGSYSDWQASQGAQGVPGGNVQSSDILPNGTTVMVTREGGLMVKDATGKTLTGQDAKDAVAEGQRMAAEFEREKYYGRREGTNAAEADTGTAAAAAGKAGEQAIDMSGEAYNQARLIYGSNDKITEAITALDNGAKSGALDRYTPDITEASASLRNAMDRLGLDVISGTTFGALSEGELRLAMETAVPRNLDEPELRAWLVRKQEANRKAAEMLMDAAVFLGTPGNTLAGWIDKNKSRSQQQQTQSTAQSKPGQQTFAEFSADPNVQKFAKQYGVTVQEMWDTRQAQGGQP